MKKLIIVTLLFCTAFAVKAQDEMFEKLAETKGVSVVYISKSMLKMMPNMKASGINIGQVAAKLNSVTVLSGENSKSKQVIKSEMKNILKKGNYEQTMFVKDDDSKTVFYSKRKSPKDENMTEILMIMEDGDEITVIRLTGDNINPADLRMITGGTPFSMLKGGNNMFEGIWDDKHSTFFADAHKQRQQTQTQREKSMKEARKIREQALKNAQKQREQIFKQREERMKELEKQRKEIEKQREKMQKNNESWWIIRQADESPLLTTAKKN